MRIITLALLAFAVLAGPAPGQTTHGQPGHATGSGPIGHQGHAGAGGADDSPATRALREANARMHQSMDTPYTNDFEVDFRRSMIPHHQGAIDMARIALEHSADPETRRLAEEIIKAQQAEIAAMRDFLKRRGAE